MKNNILVMVGAALCVTALNVSAVQRDITITADIDPTVDITMADGSPLVQSINMQYLPGKGLATNKQNVKLWSNAENKALNISLGSNPELTDVSGQNKIPLAVSINGTALSTTASTLQYSSIFPAGIQNGSIVMPLSVSQKELGVAKTAGSYSGIVSLIITQATGGAA